MSEIFGAKIKRYLHTIVIDLRYGGKLLGGVKESPFKDLGVYPTQSSDFLSLSKCFKNIVIKENDVIVDVGCGKGRVLNYLLYLKCKNKLIGIEIDYEIAFNTKERLKNYANINIIHGDVLDNIPPEATIFFVFNPFNEVIMGKFIERLEEIFKDKEITVIYLNPKHVDLFHNKSQWNVEMRDALGYTTKPNFKVAILRLGSSSWDSM